jgi:hypothetical protein
MPFDQLFGSLLTDLQSSVLPNVLRYVIVISPIILVWLLATIFWSVWVRYVRGKNFLATKYTLLEIKLPKETFKSPLAVETFLHSIHNTSDGSWYTQYWKGQTRPWYSLELVSVEGKLKFMIWTEDQRKNGIMSALYAIIPGIEIYERDDYARSVHFNPDEMKIWAAEFVLTHKKGDVYPIKTYIDYGLDKDPKEEFKVDPMVPLLEFLGSVGPNQQVWIQFLIRAHKKEERKPGHLFKRVDMWKENAIKEVNEILMRDPKTKVAGTKDAGEDFTKVPSISKGEKDIVDAIERAQTKLPFDIGIRAVYVAKKDMFDAPFAIGGIISSLKQFNSESLNGFRPNGDKWLAQFEHPWQDYKNIRRNFESQEVLKAYRRRSFFYPPYQGKPFVLNTEALATVYHFPGQVAATPTLERVPSKKSQAPSNLPI